MLAILPLELFVVLLHWCQKSFGCSAYRIHKYTQVLMYKLKFIYMYIYIFTHAVKSKFGPKMAFWGFRNLVQVLFVPFCFSFKNILPSAGGLKKNDKNYHLLSHSLVQLCCAKTIWAIFERC